MNWFQFEENEKKEEKKKLRFRHTLCFVLFTLLVG